MNWCQLIVVLVLFVALWRSCADWWLNPRHDHEMKVYGFPMLLAMEFLWLLLLYKAGTFSTLFP